MLVVPYLYFDGQCEEAVVFYQGILGGKVSEIMRYKDQSEPDLPAFLRDRILHVELEVDGQFFYFSDTMGDNDPIIGNNVQVNLNLDNEDSIRKVYAEMSDGATIKMPLQDTFWGAIYGALTDKFGVSWSFNYQKE